MRENNNNSKKKTQLVVCVMTTAMLALSACSSNTEHDSGSAAKPASNDKKVEIVWAMATDPGKKTWQEETISSFEDTHPNIKVRLENIPYDQFDQKLTTMIASGEAPDVWNPNEADSGFATYLKMGALKDLTPYVGQDVPELETMDTRLLDIYKIDGKNYGVPLGNFGTYLYYNKDLFDEMSLPYPTTDWDDQSWTNEKLLETAQKLSHDVGDVRKQSFGFSSGLSPNAMAWAFGGDFFKAEAYVNGTIGEPDLMNKNNIEALQFYDDMINKYKVAPDAQTVAASSQLGDLFLTGKVAMYITGGWGLGTYKEADFNWGVAALPYHDGRKVTLYVDPWCISESSEHPDEAWEFMRYLLDPKEGGGAYRYMNEVGGTPADTSLFADWYNKMGKELGMEPEALKQVHEGSIKYGREAENHLIVKFNTIMTAMDQVMPMVWNGEDSVEEGLKSLDQTLRSLKLD